MTQKRSATVPTDAPTNSMRFAAAIRRLAVPIIFGWFLFAAVVSTTVPTLEAVGKLRAVPMIPDEAPSVVAMTRIGQVFGEFSSHSSVRIMSVRIAMEGSRSSATMRITTTTRWCSDAMPILAIAAMGIPLAIGIETVGNHVPVPSDSKGELNDEH